MTATIPRSCIVHGPAGCGKSTNAQAIAKALGLRHIHDNWTAGAPVPLLNTLVMTSADDPAWSFNGRLLSFDQAVQLVAHEKARDQSESSADHHAAAWLGQASIYRTRLEAVQNGEQRLERVSASQLFELAQNYIREAGIHA